MTGNAQMTAHHFDERRIALRGPHRDHVTDEPEQQAEEPEPQTKAERRRQRAVDDRNRARRATQQDRLGQGATDRGDKAFHLFIHQITTPPPKEKNDKKKLEAANAMESPNTIWISRRKPP